MDHHHLGATGYTAKKKIYMAGGRKGDSWGFTIDRVMRFLNERTSVFLEAHKTKQLQEGRVDEIQWDADWGGWGEDPSRCCGRAEQVGQTSHREGPALQWTGKLHASWPRLRHVLENELEGHGLLVIRRMLIQDEAEVYGNSGTTSLQQRHNKGDGDGQIAGVYSWVVTHRWWRWGCSFCASLAWCCHRQRIKST
jgi:hypothetical protein